MMIEEDCAVIFVFTVKIFNGTHFCIQLMYAMGSFRSRCAFSTLFLPPSLALFSNICSGNVVKIWFGYVYSVCYFLLPFAVFIFISVSFSSQHHLLCGYIFHTRTQNTFYMLFCIRKVRCKAFVIGHKDLNIHFGIHLQYRQRQSIAACCCFALHRNDICRWYQPVKRFHFLG